MLLAKVCQIYQNVSFPKQKKMPKFFKVHVHFLDKTSGLALTVHAYVNLFVC